MPWNCWSISHHAKQLMQSTEDLILNAPDGLSWPIPRTLAEYNWIWPLRWKCTNIYHVIPSYNISRQERVVYISIGEAILAQSVFLTQHRTYTWNKILMRRESYSNDHRSWKYWDCYEVCNRAEKSRGNREKVAPDSVRVATTLDVQLSRVLRSKTNNGSRPFCFVLSFYAGPCPYLTNK
jgi:hypothetical protein